MQNIRLVIQYDGSSYHGWQSQVGHRTIQTEITGCLWKILKEEVTLIGSGRTDAGVHALGAVAAFKTVSSHPPDVYRRALNAALPPDIRIIEAAVAVDDFHPRFDAIKKRYFYQIYNGRDLQPLIRNYALHVSRPLDIERMGTAAGFFIGRHDFSAFANTGTDYKSTVREIYEMEIERIPPPYQWTASEGDMLVKITVVADGFLRAMIRNIVGTLLAVSSGRITPDYINNIIASRDRRCAMDTAPACGLFLDRVFYE